MGCGSNYGGTVYSGELDFTGQIVPFTFYLDFASVDGGLQGTAAINVSNVVIWELYSILEFRRAARLTGLVCARFLRHTQ